MAENCFNIVKMFAKRHYNVIVTTDFCYLDNIFEKKKSRYKPHKTVDFRGL